MFGINGDNWCDCGGSSVAKFKHLITNIVVGVVMPLLISFIRLTLPIGVPGWMWTLVIIIVGEGVGLCGQVNEITGGAAQVSVKELQMCLMFNIKNIVSNTSYATCVVTIPRKSQ